ncbi:Transcription initiation factor TFIID subunit 5 [Caenorhabditis elegans]|uniref:Transcription initiation factor TFIID subunit 5 n=1 Tax=Caenorhabditis elegans TaxID=6239 RepID=A0A5E4LZ74_CAEEL|nr:Transcription initiation factor TFIID subunit 5 [Caenorhabditis elegans]VVC12364.1 Transcription initiation factor TFIID subunit 5 [Caenorhabditis elegans]
MKPAPNAGPSSSSGSNAPSSTEKKIIMVATEQRLYELACKARAKGMFVRIPPSHKRARAVAEEMAKFMAYERYTVVKPLADLTDVHQAIKDLSFVKTEKEFQLNQRPGYSHIMTVLKEEFQNYSALAHQRGLDERGEIYQLLAHYPKLGLILQRITQRRPLRYGGVIDEKHACTHIKKTSIQVASFLNNKTRERVVNPVGIRCEVCEKEVEAAANEKLDVMHQRLEEEMNDFTVDASLQPHSFEKTFKMSKVNIDGIESQDYVKPIDTLRKIWNMDLAGIDNREMLFKKRIQQQKLTAMFNIYNDKEIGEELDGVVKEIETLANDIQEKDAETVTQLQVLKESFGGAWEKARKCLGTKSALSSDDRNIRRLQEKLEEAEKENAKLRSLLEKEKAKNRSDDGKHSSKYLKKDKGRDKDEEDERRERKHKVKDRDEASSSSSSHSFSAKRKH